MIPDDDEIDALVDRILCDRMGREESLASSGLGRALRILVSPMAAPGQVVVADPRLLDAGTVEAIWNGSGRIRDELWPP